MSPEQAHILQDIIDHDDVETLLLWKQIEEEEDLSSSCTFKKKDSQLFKLCVNCNATFQEVCSLRTQFHQVRTKLSEKVRELQTQMTRTPSNNSTTVSKEEGTCDDDGVSGSSDHDIQSDVDDDDDEEDEDHFFDQGTSEQEESVDFLEIKSEGLDSDDGDEEGPFEGGGGFNSDLPWEFEGADEKEEDMEEDPLDFADSSLPEETSSSQAPPRAMMSMIAMRAMMTMTAKSNVASSSHQSNSNKSDRLPAQQQSSFSQVSRNQREPQEKSNTVQKPRVPFPIRQNAGRKATLAVEKATNEKPVNPEAFRCCFCLKAFPRRSLLEIHLRLCHKEKESQPSTSCDGNQPSTSQNSKDPTKPNVQANNNKHIRRPFKCVPCGIYFSTQETLSAHEERGHDKDKDAPRKMCQVCGKRVYKINRHMKTHEEGRVKSKSKPYHNHVAFVCPIPTCRRRTWNRPKNIEVHNARYHAGALFPCPSCSKAYPTRGRLNAHVRQVHLKPHLCVHCGKAFGNKITLGIHERTHSGAPPPRPFGCTLCDAFLSTQGALAIHVQRVHKGIKRNALEKPLKCGEEGCGMAFSKEPFLQFHMKRKHGKG